jgi:hypothetical protein
LFSADPPTLEVVAHNGNDIGRMLHGEAQKLLRLPATTRESAFAKV